MADHHGDRLDGWKAIADCLARDERTVQRWAKTRGLPVHRLPGGRGASVFAYRRELAEWLEGGLQQIGTVPAPVTEVSAADVNAIEAELSPATRSRWRLALVAGIVIVGAVAITGIALHRYRVTAPDLVEVVANAIVAHAEGRVLWRYALPRLPETPLDASWHSADHNPSLLMDFTGDGQPEVFVSLRLLRADGQFLRSEFLCFSAGGNLLWRYVPELSFTFGEKTFEGPWRIAGWTATDVPTGPRVWLTVIHRVWWPAFVVTIDPAGQATIRFAHPGHIYALAHVTNETGSYVVAAGVNNEYASAMLAVLDERGPAAVPPSSNRSYTCQSCPEGQPVRYLLFPRSELNSLLGRPYNLAYEAAVTHDQMEVSVEEATQPNRLRAIYRLSHAFVPDDIALGDSYWEAHRALERDKRLDHSADLCPTRHEGVKVRIWEPERGWAEKTVRLSEGR